ncbi:MAG TPA: metal ABC transporter permease [Abditibacterium sp.]|jgi:manganese/zinc/iron transport system permease protein
MDSSTLWIFLIGALVAGSCALCGCFLILRRMAMLGDAISHAVLPGIALAFILSGSRASWIMFIGATLVGLFSTFLIQTLSRGGRLRSEAAIGVTFTALFAVGVVLISRYAANVDLDLDCVLYGVIEYTTLNMIEVGGRSFGPQAFWQVLAVFLLVLTSVCLFFKELKLTSFDPELAAAAGISATAVHYGLMALVSLTTVASFEPVGAILVLAMMVAPPAAAYLLCDDLGKMLVISLLIGVSSAFFGTITAEWLNVSTAGMMSVMTGVHFVLALLFSPKYGVLKRGQKSALQAPDFRHEVEIAASATAPQ